MPSSLLVYVLARRSRITVETPVAGSCKRTRPSRTVWMMRPSGSWSKPIGSLMLGGELTFVCW